jgi:aspartyl-tRNA(Asn)/glutamyl-tRNA(Gln) amidotransferase subunit B
VRLLKSGQPIIQETLLWDAEQGITLPMRGKEEAHDYRYFPEPDLVPLEISPAWVGEIAAGLPELPAERRRRFVQAYGLPEYDAAVLTAGKALAGYFEECAQLHRDVKLVSNWIMSELLGYLNRERKEITESPVTPTQLAALLKLIQQGVISGKIAKVVFEEMYQMGKSPETIIQEKGLVQITDREELGRIVDQVLAENPGPVSDFRVGKEKALTALVGAVMRVTEGKANPQLINDLLRERLTGG